MDFENKMEITVGAIVEGEVVRLKPFGAIMLLPDRMQGLVHISEISNGFVRDVGDFVRIGDKVTVKVLAIDANNLHAALSIKQVGDAKAQKFARPHKLTPLTFDERLKQWEKESSDRQMDANRRRKRNKGR